MLRSVEIPGGIKGRLFLSAMPGRFSDLDGFLGDCEASGIEVVACLASDEEISKKSPRYAALLAGNDPPFRLVRFPIEDFGVPTDLNRFSAFVDEVVAALARGEGVVLHCGEGIGRTGMAAVCILVRLGMSYESASLVVKQAGSHPETEDQYRFAEAFTQVGR